MSDSVVCKQCGHYGEPERHTKGSIWIELVLWLCFIIPGLIYSIWRLNTRANVCAKCGSTELLPIDSPLGRKLMQEVAPAALAVHETPYRPTTGRKGGLAWKLGRMIGGAGKK
jgi:hypothetical protein